MAIVLKALNDNVDIWREELLRHIPHLDIRVWPEVGDVGDIEVAFMLQPPPGDLLRYPNLKAYISLNVGVENLLLDKGIPAALPIARTVDPGLITMMSTYALYAVIRYHRGFDVLQEQQERSVWKHARAIPNSRRRVGVMGLGAIGHDIATRLSDLEFDVKGWSRTSKTIAGVETYSGLDGLAPFLSQCDILCCALPLTGETRGLLNRERFQHLPEGATFINVGRGATVVTADLLASLDSGHLGGATLDVFEAEPLPSDSPLWRYPKITITPHVAGNTTPATAAPQVAENIRRALAGEALLNQVDRRQGY